MIDPHQTELLKAVQALTEELRETRIQQRSSIVSLRNGILAGLGGVIGATILVSLLVYFLQPFKKIESLSPTIDKIDRILQKAI